MREGSSFESITKQLAEALVLEHYDPSRKLSLTMDASPYYGVGAVLSHVLDDGTKKPVAYYASRTLNPVEKTYSYGKVK